MTDSDAGISWAKLGKPWILAPWILTPPKTGGDFNNNLYVISDRFKDANGKPDTWSADVLSGVLGPDSRADYAGPGSLQRATNAFVSNVMMPKEYFPGSTMHVLGSHAVRIGGRPAWLLSFKVNYHVRGVRATEDTDVAVLVDTDTAPSPAIFVVSIPNDVAGLLPDITAELRSLQVSG
ncbi:MAG TPA: hypothetical protein VLW50_21455 [Streptosporangiaceae bacterium]|nr:hypothetical protein [Streptosporangiaceae bacterium]